MQQPSPIERRQDSGFCKRRACVRLWWRCNLSLGNQSGPSLQGLSWGSRRLRGRSFQNSALRCLGQRRGANCGLRRSCFRCITSKCLVDCKRFGIFRHLLGKLCRPLHHPCGFAPCSVICQCLLQRLLFCTGSRPGSRPGSGLGFRRTCISLGFLSRKSTNRLTQCVHCFRPSNSLGPTLQAFKQKTTCASTTHESQGQADLKQAVCTRPFILRTTSILALVRIRHDYSLPVFVMTRRPRSSAPTSCRLTSRW